MQLVDLRTPAGHTITKSYIPNYKQPHGPNTYENNWFLRASRIQGLYTLYDAILSPQAKTSASVVAYRIQAPDPNLD